MKDMKRSFDFLKKYFIIEPWKNMKMFFCRIISWYMTYIRTLGRGFTLDDPDTIAWSATTISSFIYIIYNVQINVSPEQYGTNFLYTYGDIVYFVGSCFYIFAALRDDHWFWFLPLSGQYGVAAGKVQTGSTRSLPIYGKPVILMTRPCQKRPAKIETAKKQQQESSVDNTHNENQIISSVL